MLVLTPKGLYCRAGDFYVDPSGAVDHAIVTHAHSDHARPGGAAILLCLLGRMLAAHATG